MTDPSTRTEAASKKLSCAPLAVQRSARWWGDLCVTERRFTALQITAVFATCLVTLASTVTVSSAKPPAPAKRTYLTVLVGTGENLEELGISCAKFNANGTASFDGDEISGTWEYTQPPVDQQSIINFHFAFTEDGSDFTIDGRATVDSQGKKGTKRSALGGTALVEGDGTTFTLSLAGKEAKSKKCRKIQGVLHELLGF